MKQTANQGPQTESVKQAIIRLIRDEQLESGSRLPTQEELRKRLKVGSVTVTRAVQALQEDNVLEIRGKAGVFVCDPNADGYPGRKIGLVCSRAIANPFATMHIASTEQQLHDAGCQSIHFQRNQPGISSFDGFSSYHGLKRNLEQHLIDGVISFVLFDDAVLKIAKRNRIPIVYANSCEERDNAIMIDYECLINEGIRHIAAHGFRRPAMISGAWPSMNFHKRLLRTAIKRYFKVELNDFHYAFLGDTDVPQTSSNPLSWIQQPMAKFLKLPLEERPDALFIIDDLIANWVEAELWQNSDWKPELLILSSTQLPLACPQSCIGHFKLDIMEYAGDAIDMLFKMFRSNTLQQPLFRHRPKFIPAGKEQKQKFSSMTMSR